MHTARPPARTALPAPARTRVRPSPSSSGHPPAHPPGVVGPPAVTASVRDQLIDALRCALATDGLMLDALPVRHLRTGRLDHHTLGLRWQPAGQSPLTTAALIRLAETGGLIRTLGDWLLDRAAALPQAAGGQVFTLAAPVLDPASPALRDLIDRLNQQGLPIGMDQVDAATHLVGLAGRQSLQRLGVRTLTVDAERLRGIEHDAQVLAHCEALIEGAHALGLVVIAEGAGSATRRAVLEAIGCDLEQDGRHRA